MNWCCGELLWAILLIIVVILIVLTPSVKKTKPIITVNITKSKISNNNELFDKAKKALMELGFSATEAKKMLESINANTVEEFVKKAMEKIEV